VADFRRNYAPGIRHELRFFAGLPSIRLVIHHVAMARDENGRCFEHQFRILRTARPKAEGILTAAIPSIRACPSFEALHAQLAALLAPVRGLGPLYIYDASLRLGAFLKLAPKFVYLHAGTRVGARALGLGKRRAYLEKRELPEALQVLTPDELESFLCIYKSLL
jgi:hypothetical protein